jgi:hypothetical protein
MAALIEEVVESSGMWKSHRPLAFSVVRGGKTRVEGESGISIKSRLCVPWEERLGSR